MNKTLIITGGSIDIEFACDYIKNQTFEYIIAVDGGLEATMKLNLVPGYVVGDFDTVSKDILEYYRTNPDIIFKQYNPEKDYTDTGCAIHLAVELGTGHITVLGGIGSRIDHSLANIQLLQIPLEQGIDAVILDTFNRVRLLGITKKELELEKSEYKYISLIPMTELVSGISMSGMKYLLNDYDMHLGYEISRCISNEIVDENAAIRLKEGIVIVVESRD